ncbi:MAG TPA: sigma-70 family RNA polymerase sigma factor [Thermoanaerobaculia bacterium]
METDDSIFVERAQRGDAEAFRVLVERYSSRLFRLAWRIVGEEASAEDAVQETFLRAYRALPRFDAKSQFGTWLHRIAANTAIEILRKRQRQQSRRGAEEEADDASSHEPGPDRRAFSREVDRAVREALDDLSPVERAAFVLRHYEERSIAEVCDTLGLRESAGKQAVFRAVKKLRRALEPLTARRSAREVAL